MWNDVIYRVKYGHTWRGVRDTPCSALLALVTLRASCTPGTLVKQIVHFYVEILFIVFYLYLKSN